MNARLIAIERKPNQLYLVSRGTAILEVLLSGGTVRVQENQST